jgi:hypothetical protein
MGGKSPHCMKPCLIKFLYDSGNVLVSLTASGAKETATGKPHSRSPTVQHRECVSGESMGHHHRTEMK